MLAGYCLAAAVYVAIGVTYVDFLLSVVVGMAYLVLIKWLRAHDWSGASSMRDTACDVDIRPREPRSRGRRK